VVRCLYFERAAKANPHIANLKRWLIGSLS